MFIEESLTMEGQFVDDKPEDIMRICKYRTRKTKPETKYCVYQIEARVLPVLDNQGRILYMEHSMLQHFEGTFLYMTDAGEKKSLTPHDITCEIFNIYPQMGIMHCKNGFVINGTFHIDGRMDEIDCVGIVTHPNGKSVEGTFTVKSMKDLKGLFL
jgi:hypothetical protein